jgi:hypothetical protein
MILDGLAAHNWERAEKARCADSAEALLLQPYLLELELL